MSQWTNFTDGTGRTWSVNKEALWLVLHNYVRMTLLDERTTITVVDGFHRVTTDFEKFAENKSTRTWMLAQSTRLGLMMNAERVRARLVEMARESREMVARLEEHHRKVAHAVAEKVSSDVAFGQTGVAVSRFIRNSAAQTLTICAGPVGGTIGLSLAQKLAVLGAGSLLTGVGEYQESGSIPGATISAATTLTFGMFGVVKATGTAQKVAFFVLQVKGAMLSSAARSVLDQRSAEDTVKRAVVAAGVEAVGGLISEIRPNTIAIPIDVYLSAFSPVVNEILTDRPSPQQRGYRSHTDDMSVRKPGDRARELMAVALEWTETPFSLRGYAQYLSADRDFILNNVLRQH